MEQHNEIVMSNKPRYSYQVWSWKLWQMSQRFVMVAFGIINWWGGVRILRVSICTCKPLICKVVVVCTSQFDVIDSIKPLIRREKTSGVGLLPNGFSRRL